MRRSYHTLAGQGKVNERKLAEFLAKNGQQILPMVELIAQAKVAIDDLVDVMGRATIETVLQLSAEQVAGPPQQGRRRQGEIVWHGKQAGSVYLKERKLPVQKPRLGNKSGGSGGEIGAVGVDEHGNKHVLGIREGATENAAAVKDLLENLVERGVKPERRGLFVIDGSKALRAAINAVFGSASLVQRCRQHIAGRVPRLPEGWNVPSRASPYEPGSLGSGMIG